MKHLFVKVTTVLFALTALVACDKDEEKSSVDSSIAYEIVDLGLPSEILWADRNVGAKSPEGYGRYFAWGETKSKGSYHWNTYKVGEGEEKYPVLGKYCEFDGQTVLDPENDAATAIMGPEWRMPTHGELKELIDNCTWNWSTKNGVRGYEVIGPNGNSIFLPAGGYYMDGNKYDAGQNGCYWSSSLAEDGEYSEVDDAEYEARGLNFYSGGVSADIDSYRFYGQTIRAVSLGSYSDDADDSDDVDDEDGNDDASSSNSSKKLIGKWVIQKTTTYYSDGEKDEDEGLGIYWVFTATKVTIHDGGLSDKFDYTYNANTLRIKGIEEQDIYTVKTLTDTRLVIQDEKDENGSFEIIEFKKAI